jgi:hypothetical protein
LRAWTAEETPGHDHILVAEDISQSTAPDSGEDEPWSGGGRSLSEKIVGDLDLMSGTGERKKKKQRSAVKVRK